MRSTRVDGQPRQVLVQNLHGIRSCCTKDPDLLAVWWLLAEDDLDQLVADGRLDRTGRQALLRKLAARVPRPPRAVRERFRVRKEEDGRELARRAQERERQREAERRRQAD